MIKNLSLGTGRRNTAVARIYLRDGKGVITINGKEASDYFQNPDLLFVVNQPLDVTDNLRKFDIVINVYGGGKAGQASAIRHGIARSLLAHDSANGPSLKANGFLTRDPRMVERKKFGQRAEFSSPLPILEALIFQLQPRLTGVFLHRQRGEIGRRSRLKICRLHGCVGSTPTAGNRFFDT